MDYSRWKKQLVPKEEGQGVMISSFVSHEFRYGYEPSPQIMDDVNKIRVGHDYSDTEAAQFRNSNGD